MLALGVHLIRVTTFSVRSHYSNLLREDVLVPFYPSFGRTRVADEKNERRNVNCWREKERGAKGRGKVTGWTVGVKRKGKRKTAVSGKRADQTDIYMCMRLYICFLYSFFRFLRFRCSRHGYLGFPLRDCSPPRALRHRGRLPSIVPTGMASLIAAQLRHDTSHPRARLTQSDGW